jgi:hypothetical protein
VAAIAELGGVRQGKRGFFQKIDTAMSQIIVFIRRRGVGLFFRDNERK